MAGFALGVLIVVVSACAIALYRTFFAVGYSKGHEHTRPGRYDDKG